jgi:hypothetical protein
MPRVFSPVPAHIYKLTGFADSPESSFHDRFRISDKSYDRSVSSFSRIHIEQPDALYHFNFTGYRLNDLEISAFTEVGNTFNNGCHIA